MIVEWEKSRKGFQHSKCGLYKVQRTVIPRGSSGWWWKLYHLEKCCQWIVLHCRPTKKLCKAKAEEHATQEALRDAAPALLESLEKMIDLLPVPVRFHTEEALVDRAEARKLVNKFTETLKKEAN